VPAVAVYACCVQRNHGTSRGIGISGPEDNDDLLHDPARFLCRPLQAAERGHQPVNRPDFSGRWTLNVPDSVLSAVVAPAVEGGFVHIVHREPTVAVHLCIIMEGKPIDVRFERPSTWEGDGLAFRDRVETPGGELTIFFRYELEDGGRRLRASEQLRGAREQDNIWVFDRDDVQNSAGRR
jgi:hypothetical protein